MTKLTKMPIMKVGTHTAMDGRAITLTAKTLSDLAVNYAADHSEAPIVIGHPNLTAPAYGWVKALSFEDDTLYAQVGQVDAAFAEAANAGRYKRSASIFLPDTPGNPKPGHHYLRHVGFLGAVPPAVKGLADVNFAETSGDAQAYADFAFDETETSDSNSNLNPNSNPQENPMSKEQDKEQLEKDVERENALAAREAALNERETALAAAEAAQAEADKAAQTQAAGDFADRLVKSGKLKPAHKAGLIEIMLTLNNQPISFSDGAQTVTQSSVELLQEVLSATPLDFSEKSGIDNDGETDVINFADGADIARHAAQYQQTQAEKGIDISITDAVNHIMKGATV